MKTIALSLLILIGSDHSMSEEYPLCLGDALSLLQTIIPKSVYSNHVGAYFISIEDSAVFELYYVLNPYDFNRLKPNYKSIYKGIVIYESLTDNYNKRNLFNDKTSMNTSEIDSVANSLSNLGTFSESIYLKAVCNSDGLVLVVEKISLGDLQEYNRENEAILEKYSLEPIMILRELK